MKHRSNRLLAPLCAALFACASVASPQNAKQSESTPRALMEQAAFAEEHQRDFTTAARLYEDAVVAARAAGDAGAAADAAAARDRVLARMGKAPKGQAQIDEQTRAITEPLALEILHDASSGRWSREDERRLGQRLADLGPSIVPLLENSLNWRGVAVGLSAVPRAPEVAAHALALMRSDAADLALVRAYESPDPMVRRAIVVYSNDARFTDLYLRAIDDPVASIRSAALAGLQRSNDTRATPYFEAAARAGDSNATQWLACNAVEDAFALAADPSVPDATRYAIPSTVEANRQVNADLARLAMRVVYVEAPSKSTTARASWSFAAKYRSEACTEEECKRLESELLEAARSVDRIEIIYMLVRISSVHSVRAAIDQIRLKQSRLDVQSGKDLYDSLKWVLEARTTTVPIEDRVELFLTWPKAWWILDKRADDHARYLEWAASAAVGASSGSTVGQIEALWSRTPLERRTSLAAAYCRRIAADLKEQRRPASASAFEREMIAHLLADKSADQDDAVQLVGLLDIAELIPALTEVAPTSQSEAENALRALATNHTNAVRQAVKAAARASLVGSQENPTFTYPLGWMLSLAPDQRFPLWQELWKLDLPPAGRKRLLDFLCRPGMESAARDESMVELYSAFEAHAPAARPWVLQQFGASLVEAALPILERELRNQDADVRSAAMDVAEQFRQHREALAEFEAWRQATTVERETVAELSKLLESDKRDVVIGAVKALGILRARPALPALVKLLARDDAELRTAVQAAIDAIGS